MIIIINFFFGKQKKLPKFGRLILHTTNMKRGKQQKYVKDKI